MSRFAFADGAPFKGDADEVQAEIERLRRSGGATPEAVVACARSKRSVLHPLIFNVSSDVAAERYYLGRAATLLSSIRIVTDDGETTMLRANIRVSDGEEFTYRSLDEDAARAAREAWLFRRLRSIKAELQELKILPRVIGAIEDELGEAA